MHAVMTGPAAPQAPRDVANFLWRSSSADNALAIVTAQISYLADAIVEVGHALARRRLIEKRGQPRGPDGKPARFVVLGMGKLGGDELNYSSDIDLIFLYDVDGKTDGPRSLDNGEFFDRLVRDVVRLLTEPTDLGDRLSRRPAAAARRATRPASCRVWNRRLHYYDVRRPHLGTPGVRQGPPRRRRSATWAASFSNSSSRGSIAAI